MSAVAPLAAGMVTKLVAADCVGEKERRSESRPSLGKTRVVPVGVTSEVREHERSQRQ